MKIPLVRAQWPMRTARLVLLLAAVGCLPLSARAEISQDESLTLATDAVSPQRFMAAHGRRALLDGYGSQSLEAWIYPFQIFRGYRVAFRFEGSTTPINGPDVLTRIEYKPNAVTRIYLGPDFKVREKLFVPLNQAGAILSYSIQSEKPVEIEVHATPGLNLMWPAGLGGQSVRWNPSLSAFVLSEPAHGFTAVVGSPEIVAHDDIGNRTTQGAEGTEIGFTLRPDASGVARVFVALNPPHASDSGSLFRALIRDQKILETESAAHLNQFRDSVLKVRTPDDRVNQAIAWSEIALDQAWVCNPDLGCGYVGGYGPSRGERRPQYDWFFAGDGLVAAEAAINASNSAQARDELEFILRYQDSKTGMIWHELSQSAGFLDWAGKYPYMYAHVDITFQFLSSLGHYETATADSAFAREHWPAIEAAYRYCLSLVDHSTALPRIPPDKEGGNEQDKMSDDLGLSTSWVQAASAFAQLASMTGHSALADEASRASRDASNAIPGRYWDASHSFWISGHTQAGEPMSERRSGPTEALTLHLFSRQQNTLILDQLASSSFQTDWGTRGIGEGSVGFDPASYAKGSVWPVGTAAQSVAFWTEHRPVAALSLWRTLLPLTSIDSLGHVPEVLAGNFYRPQEESVPEQTWSSAGFLDATIHGLLGLQVNSISNRVVFAPRIPAAWNDVSIEHIRLGSSSIALALHRTPSGLALHVDNPGDPFQLEFAPDLPLGATLDKAVFDDHAIAATIENHPQQTIAKVVLDAPHGSSELHVDFAGGISVLVETPAPMLGDRSTGVRIVDVHLDGALLNIDADVPTDRASQLQIETTRKIAGVIGADLRQMESTLLNLTFVATPNASAPYRRAHATLEMKP